LLIWGEVWQLVQFDAGNRPFYIGFHTFGQRGQIAVIVEGQRLERNLRVKLPAVDNRAGRKGCWGSFAGGGGILR